MHGFPASDFSPSTSQHTGKYSVVHAFRYKGGADTGRESTLELRGYGAAAGKRDRPAGPKIDWKEWTDTRRHATRSKKLEREEIMMGAVEKRFLWNVAEDRWSELFGKDGSVYIGDQICKKMVR